MSKIAYALLLSFVVGVFSVNPAFAIEDFVFTINSLPKFEEGKHPFVNGEAVTLDNNPVSDVQIQVNFPSERIKVTTNSTGQFNVTALTPAEIGEYTIIVYAKKDNKFTEAEIFYQVIEKSPMVKETQIEAVKTSNENKDKKELDPFSKMIQELEKQKATEVKRESDLKEKQEIDEKREYARKDLQKDLEEDKKRNEPYTLRNMYYKFIQDIDISFRGIFWQQLLFTERITQQAEEARDKAILEGKSSFEAMKVFQKEASVTQKEIMEFNKNSNIMYGNATSDVQNLFDEHGKLPREE